MSIELARAHLQRWNRHNDIREFTVSSATVALAAAALGVDGARIAKTLTFTGKADTEQDRPEGGFPAILVVCAGDAKVDNVKFKKRFEVKAKMLSCEDVEKASGHQIGGVCPFGCTNPLARIYLDISLRRFDSVFPACGSSNSAIELSCEELFEYSGALDWVDVCKDWS